MRTSVAGRDGRAVAGGYGSGPPPLTIRVPPPSTPVPGGGTPATAVRVLRGLARCGHASLAGPMSPRGQAREPARFAVAVREMDCYPGAGTAFTRARQGRGRR